MLKINRGYNLIRKIDYKLKESKILNLKYDKSKVLFRAFAKKITLNLPKYTIKIMDS